MSINQLFGENLCKFRVARSYSQAEFVRPCGISRAYYGRFERVEHSITLDACQRVTDVLEAHLSAQFIDLS